MWLEKKLLTFTVGVWLILGIGVFSGCVKQDTSPASKKAETPSTEQVQKDTKTPPQEAKQETVVNSSFSKGIDGWVLAGGRIRSEADGNKYLEAECNWQNYQIVSLEPNAMYSFNASTRRNTGTQEARFKIIFFDKHAQRLGWYSIHYTHQGSTWENIPTQTIKVPDGTKETIIYVLADREKEVHDFDNISLTKMGTETSPIPGKDITVTFNTSPERVVNGNFDYDFGWFGLAKRIKIADDGNRYLICGYHWEVSQIISLIPDKKYQFNAATKKGTSSGPARFVLVFFDGNDQKLSSTYNLSYQHQGSGWENIPAETIDVPDGVTKARLYILSGFSNTGYHYYDNISLTEVK